MEKLCGMWVLSFIWGYLYSIILDISVYPIKRKWRRQCNYDCSKCKVWDCERHDCLNQKRKELKKLMRKINEKECK